MSERAVLGPSPFTTREGVLVTLALLAVIGLQLVLIDGLYLFSKHFWLDELYTYAVVADPELGHALRAIHGGIDSFPLYQLLLRGLSIFAAPSEVLFRTVSLGSVVLALAGVYVLLRRSLAPLVAFTAILAIWAHPLTGINAFDARFYAPFLAASVWFCYWIDRRQAAPDRLGTAVALAGASLMVCGIHVFGVIAWAVALVGEGLISRRWRPLWPALAGPVVVPVFWILAFQPQRVVVTIPTWEAAFSWATAASMVEYVLFPAYLAAVFVLMWGVLCVQRIVTLRSPQITSSPPAPALLLLTSLSLMVPVIVVVSLVVQPTLTPRYVIPAIAALAPAVAYGLTRIPRWGCAVVMAALIVVSTRDLRLNLMQARAADQRTEAMMQEIRELPAGQPVVFEVPFDIGVIWHYVPDLRDRMVLLDFKPGQVPHPSPVRVVTRDLARAYGRFYDGPRFVPWDEVGSATEFYLVRDFRAWAADAPSSTPETRYPGFTLSTVGVHIAKATRR